MVNVEEECASDSIIKLELKELARILIENQNNVIDLTVPQHEFCQREGKVPLVFYSNEGTGGFTSLTVSRRIKLP